MLTEKDLVNLIPEVSQIARQAGEQILDIYERGFDVHTKVDGTPLTTADRASHEIICRELAVLDGNLPVLSEESASESHSGREGWRQFWLVDPLDGTREFVKRNGEFTVNIALIDGNRPVLGVVHTPVKGLTYWAHAGGSAYRYSADGETHSIQVRQYHGGPPQVVASRSHARESLTQFLQRLEEREGGYDTISMGSALKICIVAEGRGDVYPRLGPTYEWDTAAAQCVIESAGGKLTDCHGVPLRYNKSSLLNPWFVASGSGDYDWYGLLEGIEDTP
jgi:3'(2'), 5'-bisphosphate nucleotidase